jgi:hypothetical protein
LNFCFFDIFSHLCIFISNFELSLRNYEESDLLVIKNLHKGKIDSTNNKIEDYIGNIMLKADKNKFRTVIGFMNQF